MTYQDYATISQLRDYLTNQPYKLTFTVASITKLEEKLWMHIDFGDLIRAVLNCVEY